MSEPRVVVVDTSVLVSAVSFPGSIPHQAFEAVVTAGTLLVSAATLDELHGVLNRAKFDRYASESQRIEFLAALMRRAKSIDVTLSSTECRDANDNKFLELALDGKATHIISSDQDLLCMHPFRGVRVVTPRAFLAELP